MTNTDHPTLACPGCGNTDPHEMYVATLQWEYASVVEIAPGHVLTRDNSYLGDVERQELRCNRCHADIPLPKGWKLQDYAYYHAIPRKELVP